MQETIFSNSQAKNWAELVRDFLSPHSIHDVLKIDFAKQHKGFFVDNTEHGDTPPTIIAERNGEVFAIVISSKIDEDFQASHILRHTAGADSLVLIFDAHVRNFDVKNDYEFLKNYKHGDMQLDCDDKGVRDSGTIGDCLVCHRINDKGEISAKILPYSYYGKGTNFKWTEPDSKHEGAKFEGVVPDILCNIMNEKTFANNQSLMQTAKKYGLDEERIFYHAARVAFKTLREHGFYVFDLLSCKHPEWCDAAKKAEQLILLLSDNEVLPKVAIPNLAKVVSDHIGKPSFQVEVAKILVKYKDKFAKEHAEIPDDAESFANWLHQACFRELIELIEEINNVKNNVKNNKKQKWPGPKNERY